MRTLIVAACFVLGSWNCFADSSVEGVAVEVFHVAVSGGKSQSSPGSVKGVSILRDRFDILERSSGIPLLKGHGLAVTFTLNGKYQNLENVRLVVVHPEMKAPDGKTYSGVDRKQKALLTDGTRMVAFSYAFDEAWELVEGIWIVQIFHEETQLGEAQVIAYKPEPKKPDK